MDKSRRIIRDGAVVIDGTRIVDVGKSGQVNPRAVDKVIDARGKIVMPGLVDTHVHNEQTLARGLGDDIGINIFTFERIWPYEAVLSEDAAYSSALLSCVEMIRTGTTCCADTGGYNPGAVARAIRETGFR